MGKNRDLGLGVSGYVWYRKRTPHGAALGAASGGKRGR